jgi:hypothetical protein
VLDLECALPLVGRKGMKNVMLHLQSTCGWQSTTRVRLVELYASLKGVKVRGDLGRFTDAL